jgi:glycosyltransferase involved in cell wall biosynthesis
MAYDVAYVLPRKTQFGPSRAGSTELCVSDLVRFSRFKETTTIFCPPVERPFDGLNVEFLAPYGIGGVFARALDVATIIRRRRYRAAVVEQNWLAANVVASLSGVPTLFHTHSQPKTGSTRLQRMREREKYRRYDRTVVVSQFCLEHFRAHFPGRAAAAVCNGLDMTEWRADRPKEKTILSVGRAVPFKGHLEAMRAIVDALASEPEWTAQFILSDTESNRDYVDSLRAMAERLPRQIRIDADLEYAAVKDAWERAAIGMVLSNYQEPFGRTALEALASGAALITSGTGGLKEICGPHAVFVDPGNADRAAQALHELIRDPRRRSELGEAARSRVSKLFDIRRVAASMDDVIAAAMRES